MPTASERAAAEAESWREVSGRWSPEGVPELYGDVAPSEVEVVVFFDPADDLHRRAGKWELYLERPHLDELARFAAELAETEALAWTEDIPDLALRAYEARRLLVADRITHWTVPWLDSVARSYPRITDDAARDRDTILDIGDEMRIAPDLAGKEGLVVLGEDAFGPITVGVPLEQLLRSLWSGDVLLDAGTRDYGAAAGRWRSLAATHPGSATLWLDLADRADRTARALGEL